VATKEQLRQLSDEELDVLMRVMAKVAGPDEEETNEVEDSRRTRLKVSLTAPRLS
jgi:hypothetical protein